MLPLPFHFMVLLVASWLTRRQNEAIDYLRAENRLLRRRLPRRLRFTDAERRLLAEKGKVLGRKWLAEIASLATPDTILRWYRNKVAAKYDGKEMRQGRRPASRAEKTIQLVTMARENPSWGYTRLAGALDNLGLHLGRSTVRRILLEHGIEPAPARGRRMPWRTFLKAHWGAIAAADFFAVEVLTLRGLVRHMVLFVIDLKTRRVRIAGIAAEPDGKWMLRVARTLIGDGAHFFRGIRQLIVDRDSLYTVQFAKVMATAGVELLRLPPYSPNLNAYAERFIRSIRQECLRHVVPLGEHHLRQVIDEFVEHYHGERNHQGLGNRIPCRPPIALAERGPIRKHERLGGLLKFYDRAAYERDHED